MARCSYWRGTHPISTWWVSEPDRGQGHAVNKGLEQCNGDLVAFIGADDVYLPNAFADAAAGSRRTPTAGPWSAVSFASTSVPRVISEAVPARYPGLGPWI